MFFYSEQQNISEIVILTLTSNVNSLDFGDVDNDTSSSLTFTISAAENGITETVTLSDNSSQFDFSPSSFSLTGGGTSQTVTVKFAPTSLGVKIAQLNFSASGGNTGSISLQGTSVGWTEQQILTGSLITSGDYFGGGLAINEFPSPLTHVISLNSIGDRMIIGAPYDERSDNNSMSGIAYIYVSGANGWTQEKALSGSLLYTPNTSGDMFGSSVYMNAAGDRVVIGAPHDEVPISGIYSSGLAYVFVSGANGWTEQQILSGSLAIDNDDTFGSSVAMNSSGNRIVVGAKGDDAKGTAYIFTSSSAGWAQERVFTEPFTRSYFGMSVDMNSSGERIIVGSPGTRRVHVYTSGSNGWYAEADISSSIVDPSNEFARTIAMNASGNVIVIGAREDQPAGSAVARKDGLVYVFVSGTNGWVEQAIISSSINEEYLFFGFSVDINSVGDRIAATALNPYSTSGQGHCAIYVSGSSGWREEKILSGSLTVQGNQAFSSTVEWFGYSVAMNSDGQRVAVGAPKDEPSGSATSDNTGLVYVFGKK